MLKVPVAVCSDNTTSMLLTQGAFHCSCFDTLKPGKTAQVRKQSFDN